MHNFLLIQIKDQNKVEIIRDFDFELSKDSDTKNRFDFNEDNTQLFHEQMHGKVCIYKWK